MRITPLCTAAILACTAPALAAADNIQKEAIASPAEGIILSIAAVTVFLIVLFLLGTRVWPMISKGLDERAEKIKSEIEAAEMAQQQAKSALEEYERNLAHAREEAQAMLDRAKTQQQEIAAELRAKADTELAQMRDRARQDIEAAKRAAVADIYNHAAEVSTAMASKILQREIRAEDQQQLIRESLQQFQQTVSSN